MKRAADVKMSKVYLLEGGLQFAGLEEKKRGDRVEIPTRIANMLLSRNLASEKKPTKKKAPATRQCVKSGK